MLSLEPGKKRRERAYLSGIVTKSLPEKVWRVYWNYVNCTCYHKRGTLTFLAPCDCHLTQADFDVLNDPTSYIDGGSDAINRYIQKGSYTTDHSSTTATSQNTIRTRIIESSTLSNTPATTSDASDTSGASDTIAATTQSSATTELYDNLWQHRAHTMAIIA